MGLVAFVVASWAWARFVEPLASIDDLSFGFGPYVRWVRTHGTFGPGFERMPVLPLFHGLFARWVSDDPALGQAARALLLGGVTWPAWALLRRHVGGVRFVAMVIGLLLVPAVTRRLFDLHTEEAWTMWLVPAATLPVLLGALQGPSGLGWRLYVGSLAGLTFLVKSSALPFGVVLVGLAAWPRGGRFTARDSFAVAGPFVAAVLGWGAFVFVSTGHVSLGTTRDGYNLRKGNHAEALALYPETSLDSIVLPPARPGEDAWKHDAAFRSEALEWARNNPVDGFTLTVRKVRHSLFGVEATRAPGQSGRGWRDVGRVAAMLLWRVVLWLTLLSPWLFRRAGRTLDPVAARAVWMFALVGVAYLLPFWAGFFYERHGVPLIVLGAGVAAIVWGRGERSNPA